MRAGVPVIKLTAIVTAVLVIGTATDRLVRPAIGQQVQPLTSGRSQAMAERRAQLLLMQTQADADRKSAGCKSCHTKTDSDTSCWREASVTRPLSRRRPRAPHGRGRGDQAAGA